MGICKFDGLNFQFKITYNPFSSVSHANIFMSNFPESLIEPTFTEPLGAECFVRHWTNSTEQNRLRERGWGVGVGCTHVGQATGMNCSLTLGCERKIPPKSHQIWLSALPMPRSALSSTSVVGVISFPMNCTKILGFLWPENRRRLSNAWPTVTVPVGILFCLLPALFPATPVWVPTSPGCFRVETPAFRPQRKSSPPLHPTLGVYSVSWCNPLCLVFKAPASIPSFPCPVPVASSESHQHLGNATFPEEQRHRSTKVKLL